MPQAIIYFDDKQDKKIKKLSKLWEMSKHNVVKKIVDDYVIQNGANNSTNQD
jgi:hypothetical protein